MFGNKRDPIIRKNQKENDLLKKQLRQITSNSVRSEYTGGSAGYTLATLPAPNKAGMMAYCSDCRKAGEGAGAGTGVFVGVTLLLGILTWVNLDDQNQAAQT